VQRHGYGGAPAVGERAVEAAAQPERDTNAQVGGQILVARLAGGQDIDQCRDVGGADRASGRVTRPGRRSISRRTQSASPRITAVAKL